MPSDTLSHLTTPYPLDSKEKKIDLATLKVVLRIKFSSHIALGIDSFPDRITTMSFYQKYYQLFLHGKFSMKEKNLLVVGPPDSEKTSWFAPFQGILTNTALLLCSEKVTTIICSGILFTKNLLSYRSQSIYLHFKSIAWFLHFTRFY